MLESSTTLTDQAEPNAEQPPVDTRPGAVPVSPAVSAPKSDSPTNPAKPSPPAPSGKATPKERAPLPSPELGVQTGVSNSGKSKTGKWVFLVLGIVLVAGSGLYIQNNSGREPDPCEQALNKAASFMTGGDAASARNQTMMAMAACNGEAQTKARHMLAVADKAIAARAACERSVRQIGSMIVDRRLTSARNAIDQLGSTCVDGAVGSDLRGQINVGLASAASADAEARNFLAMGDLKSAREALDKVVASNREFSGLTALRQELQTALRTQERPPQPTVVSSSPSVSQSVPPVTKPHHVAPLPPVSPPAVNVQSEMAQGFLRDAEAALRQMKFDTAKTYVESALRVDPKNSQANVLSRRIRERELQYLNEETSIK